MRDWLARKKEEWTREHPPLSDYEPGQLVRITTGGTYQNRMAQVAPHSLKGQIDLLDPFTLKPLARFLSHNCISPALDHEREDIESKAASDIYFMMQSVVLRKDAENQELLTFPPVYQIASVIANGGGVKLKNPNTDELLLDEDGEPIIIKSALELRPPTDDESRHARTKPAAEQRVQVSGPEDGQVESTIMPADKIDTPTAANSDKASFDLHEALSELGNGHTLLAHRIGSLKLRTPFKQALAAEKAGKELAADQRSAVNLIHAMEDALRRARGAQRSLFDNKTALASGLPSQEHDDI